MTGFAAPDDPTPPAPPAPPKPVRIAIRYVPELGYRRVLVVTDDAEVDISAAVRTIKGFEVNPRGPSQITLDLQAELDEIDWVWQTVGVLGDPMAAVNREDLGAVIASAIASSGMAEPAHMAATTAVVEHLRAVFGRAS